MFLAVRTRLFRHEDKPAWRRQNAALLYGVASKPYGLYVVSFTLFIRICLIPSF
jgi:hypothetical protein